MSVTDGCDVIDDVCEHVRMGANPDMVADILLFLPALSFHLQKVYFSGPNPIFPNCFMTLYN